MCLPVSLVRGGRRGRDCDSPKGQQELLEPTRFLKRRTWVVTYSVRSRAGSWGEVCRVVGWKSVSRRLAVRTRRWEP